MASKQRLTKVPNKIGRAVDRDLYECILDAFYQYPGNISRAATEAGVSRSTARKAWNEGWPQKKGFPPIKDIVGSKKDITENDMDIEIRARRDGLTIEEEIEILDAEEEKRGEFVQNGLAKIEGVNSELIGEIRAQEDAIDSLSEEAKMVRKSRRNTINLLSVGSHLLGAAINKARNLELKLKSGQEELTTKETIRFILSCAEVQKIGCQAAKLSLEMERMIVGAPTEVIGVDVNHITLDDADRYLEIATEGIKRARKMGVASSQVLGLPEHDSNKVTG